MKQIKFKGKSVDIFFILFLTTAALVQGQHRPGFHNGPAFRSREGVRTRNQFPTTTENSLDDSTGYIILSMKESTEDVAGGIGTSTARVQEVPDASESSVTIVKNDNNGSSRVPSVKQINRSILLFGGYFRRDIWTIPLISIILLNLFLILFFEIYVLCQAKGQSPLFLGQCLLLGLFVCSALSLVYVVSPSLVNCYFGSFGISVSYTLIFSVLMVKSIFLISLDSGHTLPLIYQGILLLFSVLVQVAISLESVLLFPPQLYQVSGLLSRSFWSECGTSWNQTVWTMVGYNVFLIFVVSILALKTRRIRENYGESTYIGLTIMLTVPIWICWILAACVLQGRYRDACVAFGCQAQCLITFLIMFMPKGRQLAAMGDGGKLLAENQEDEYSPSFFHFKPGKYYKHALTDPSTTSYNTLESPTFSAINPNVYFYRTDFHPGMIY